MASGTNVVAGKSTTSKDTTEIIADAPSPTIDFTGSLILKVGPQAGALSPRHDVTGIECAGSNGGGGITGVGGLDNGAGVSGYGGGGPITTGAGGVGVSGHGGPGSRAKNVDPGVGVIGVGGSADVLSIDYAGVVAVGGPSRNRNGFVVEELNAGKSGVRFSYRIVGKRRDLEAKRFAKVVLPKLSDRSSPRTLRKTAQSKMKGKHKR